MSTSQDIPTVNFHLWEPCNMRCRFCFAPFQDVKQSILPKGHLPKDDAISVVDQLAESGFKKINFAGGEPTLCPWLSDLIRRAKERGMTTSIVTNGSRITDSWLDSVSGILNWIALSIDTLDQEKLKYLGRAIRSRVPITKRRYLEIVNKIKRCGMRLKINTVVTSMTWQDDFTHFIRLAKPERWKLLQVLPVKGQNDAHIDELAITTEQFEQYVKSNRVVENEGIDVVPESNKMMTGSYVMVDPAGRLFDNTQGAHTYSSPILDVGVEKALKGVSVDSGRFLQRKGQYDW